MKKALIFLANGFEEIECLTVVDVLKRANLVCDMCSIEDLTVKGAHGIEVKSDLNIKDIDIDSYNAVILPGGMPGATNLRDNSRVIEVISDFYNKNKIVAAICAAPIVFCKAGIIKDKKITSYPGFENELKGCTYFEDNVVQDKNIITSRGPATALEFAFKILENLSTKDIAKGIKSEMLFD